MFLMIIIDNFEPISMELRQLKTFITVGRLLSFYRAADTLHYAQSTVSAQIKMLEEEFGVPLFDRLGKKVFLTEAGERLMQYADKMLAIEEETKAGVLEHEAPRGCISLRIPESIGTYLLAETFAEFRKNFPLVNCNISSCALHALRQEFKSGVTDLAFLIADTVSAPELQVEALGFTTVIAVCHPQHPSANGRLFALKDFAGETLILPKQDCSYKMAIENEMTTMAIQPQAQFEMTSTAMIKRCVAQGAGVAILPEIAVRAEIASGSLKKLNWEEPGREQAVLMLWHKDKWLFPALAAFMAMTRNHVGKLLASRGL